MCTGVNFGMLMMFCWWSLSFLHDWFSLLCLHGPNFAKSFVVGEQLRNRAIAMFHDLGVQVVTDHRFLDGSLPEQEEYNACYLGFTSGWDTLMFSLNFSFQPRLAYAVLTRSLQHE